MNPIDRPDEILDTTLEFKAMKKILYESATRRCSDTAGIALFSFLRDRESEQIEILSNHRAMPLSGGRRTPFPLVPAWDWERAEAIRKAIFQREEPAAPNEEDLIALENSLAFEQACLQFFVYSLEEASEPIEKQFLTGMISEGKEHLALLSDLGLQFSIHRKRATEANSA